ncbi:hydratase [Paralimibaculum aggregatum]|uniref:Hydratase n=1 Tax=Paralimibaculum aggregatum TaxID=3036245 RepID=A0ABQ6LQL4_9RHOB|nr:fumarylacetoacetate hydrolase family protein [Limibaculum sp. NKW23]GMG82900.1 hydratase [Limibaculum sp. NKW23]
MQESTVADRFGAELVALLGTKGQIAPFSGRQPGFGLDDAYRVASRVRGLRAARGERPVGRKIGFTNRSIWAERGISAPVWGDMFDSTVTEAGNARAVVDIGAMPEPKIEPEVVLHLGRAPEPGMSPDELFACVDWAAPGFEVVYSVFPGWAFSAPDAVAAHGIHGALVIGERLDLSTLSAAELADFSGLTVTLSGDDGTRRHGVGTAVLGGPLRALGFLAEELAQRPGSAPLSPGEIITTGTLTEAMPLSPGQVWTASFEGVGFAPLELAVR